MMDEAARAEMRRLVLGDGWKIGTVARRFSVHHSAVRRAVFGATSDKGRVGPPSALEPHKVYIVERLEKFPQLTAARLLLELRERGYDLGIAILRRYIAKVRGPRERKAYLRIEVGPGEQAQVDWGSFGWMRVGTTQRPLSCFVMVLSWSRALFFDFALDQRMETFCALHQRAFEFFGGVPQKLLPDYVPCNIIVVMCPSTLCVQRLVGHIQVRWSSYMREHNAYSLASQLSSVSSECQTARRGSPTEVSGSSQARSAASFVLGFISA
jgi:transposase